MSCFRLSREGQPIYLLWSDGGEPTVDLSGEVDGRVRATNAAGEESVLDAKALPLTEEPIVVEAGE